MPIYEYECAKCKKHHEVIQKITEKPLKKCPDCGGSMRKLMSSTSFVLKGSGWYASDYPSDKNKVEAGAKNNEKSPAASKPRIEGVEKTEGKTDVKESTKSDTKESKAS
jgi:putative FmdB family regulatory protein